MFCYSNDGASFRAVPSDYAAGAGEVLFENYATSDQLSAAFSGYAAPLSGSQKVLQASAIAALAVSDLVAIRCFKAGVAWPAAWQTYVVALRAIVANPASASSLPTLPSYPAGS